MATILFGLLTFGARIVIDNSSLLNLPGLDRKFTIAACLGVYFLAVFWESQVTRIVPEPYLDEVFHIPQAQAYCRGDWLVWDPKLTTPPGLYVFTTLFAKLHIASCSVHVLRFFNTVALLFTLSYACDCRNLITLQRKCTLSQAKALSKDTLHTAINISLFPPLFFFSGLYYTDVLSTCVVLRLYRSHLRRKNAQAGPNLWIYVWGMLALTMRQTNIFWGAVFVGGLEVMRMLRNPMGSASIGSRSGLQSFWGFVNMRWGEAWKGMVHDVDLSDACLEDILLTPITLIPAILRRLPSVLYNLTPHILLLLTFSALVYLNGGVVLGDKSNHVATIHLPQLLYLWPFICFFAFPLLLPSLFSLLYKIINLPSTLTNYIRNPTFRPLILLYLAASSLLTTLAVIKYNTIIHPFTLADNRHYIFYVFRYSILRHPLIRYILAPIYLFCFWIVYDSLAGESISSPSSTPNSTSTTHAQKKRTNPSTSLLPIPRTPTTNFLIYILTTALSLITAPLVEPRYYILPYTFLRLHLPSSYYSSAKADIPTQRAALRKWGIWLETLWYVVINLVTGYVFLYRGFTWVQEEGKVQRFMW